MLKKIILITSYLVVAAAIVAGTTLLVWYGRGYSYDFRLHTLVANGLLILDSQPGGARLLVDGKLTRRTTPYRSTMRVGSYDLELAKDGYRTWKKHVEIVASEVENLASIILVPNDIKRSLVGGSTGTKQLLSSSDHKHLASITGGSSAGLWSIDVGGASGRKVYSQAPATTITSGSLSRDGSRVLLRVQQADGVHVLYVDMGNGQVKDLSSTFKVGFDDLRFSFNDANILYWLSADGLRRVDVNAGTLSSVLADKVASYTYDGGRIIFVQSTPVGKTIKVMDGDGRNTKALIQGVAESPSYLLSYASYRGQSVLGVVPTSNGQLTVYQDIYSDTTVSRTVTKDVTRLVSSDDGHYMVFGRAAGFGSYDVGRAKLYDGLYTDKIDAMSWFNGAHLIINSGGKTRMVEFDGGNATDIGDSAIVASIGMHDERHIVYVDSKTGKTAIADLRK